MSTTDERQQRAFGRDACSLADFREIVERRDGEFAFADRVEQGVPVYDASAVRRSIASAGSDRPVRDELASVLDTGPGIVVLADAFDVDVVERATSAFETMITKQRAAGDVVGDHFARPGANDRVWNAIEKLALAEPETFVDYYANDMVGLAARAWLGPGYQISSQVNVVNPGGEAQSPHRDYHIGFMTDDEAEAYPAHAHLLSPMLTLQGAIAHCEMPVESGPTMYLPYSQRYPLGYLAWRRPEFIDYFHRHHAQLPLSTGDAVFFNPAVFHGAGSNRTADVRRIANLLQISSAMGRPMETMDRIAMSKAVYDALQDRVTSGLSDDRIVDVATAVADGYAFPTNLDKDPPLGGLTPPSHLDILLECLHGGVSSAEFAAALDALVDRRRSD